MKSGSARAGGEAAGGDLKARARPPSKLSGSVSDSIRTFAIPSIYIVATYDGAANHVW